MIKILAFLLILCILFGVEATRALIFGTFGFIFWAAIIFIGICLLINVLGKPREKQEKTPEQIKKDKGDAKSNIIAYILLAVFIGAFVLICFLTSK